MDISKLAQDLTGILAPCLPYLINAGKDFAKVRCRLGQRRADGAHPEATPGE